VYIPAIKKLDDELKFTNKSAINKLVSKYFIDHIRNDENCSCKYREISTKVNELSELLKKEDSGPCESLKSYVNKYMLDYGDLNFSVTLVPPMLDEFIKNSFNISVLSNGSNLSLDSQGMGFQRSLLFSLLCIIADINGNSYPTIYLIEEPELYLHPNHQIHFRDILIKLSQKENNQILATSHSPYFVNHINKYSQIKVVSMNEKRSQINQISQDDVNAIVEEDANTRLCCELDYIYGRYSDEEIEHIKDIKKNDDHLRYLLWMDPLRANAFFSKKCILVEGSTEKAFFSFIFYHPEGALYSTDTSNVAIFDTVGKFNIIPFANLLKKLGIDVWVIFDDDEGKEANGISHNKINEYIEKLVSDNIAIKCLKLNSDIEKFLGVEKNSRKPDISLYQKLVDNKNECLHTEGYSKIVEFVESVLEYRY
jgi:predicted ATP-dependent endonuclease of OLD family